MSAAIELVGLTRRFGAKVAVDHLSLSVPEGSLFGLIGPNGAGKTTTFSMLCGFLRPTEGEIRVRGERVEPGLPRAGKIVALPQDAQLLPELRTMEALIMLGRLSGLAADQAESRGKDALQRLGLSPEVARQRVGTLSHGQRRRVGIAQTLLGDREIILLDEPTAGLDPGAAAELRELVKALRGARTVILSSHNLAEVEQLCDHAAIIDRGKLVSSGTMDQLRQSSKVVRITLGAALANPDTVLSQIGAVAGVRGARTEEGATVLILELAAGSDTEADALTNRVLKGLMDLGSTIRGVERGKSLEARFLEETSRNTGS